MPLASLTLVLGGAASGKSRFAEGLVSATELSRVYIATAQAFDAEMTAKIADHRQSRGKGWRTVEEPLDLPKALGKVTPDEVVLIDCATLWLSNQMMAGSDLDAATTALLSALKSCVAPVVVVSNEVGSGIVPEHRLSRQFRQAQGKLNQQLAAQADLAALVVAGLPLVLKGQLP